MKPRALALVAGIIIAIAGIVLLVMPVNAAPVTSNIFSGAATGTMSVSCGAVFSPHDYSGEPILMPVSRSTLLASCADAVSSRATLAWVLLGLGVLVTVGAAVVKTKPTVPVSS